MAQSVNLYTPNQVPEPALSRTLYADTRFAWLWLVIRLYVGWQWLQAGWEKLQNPVWIGDKAGVAITGFVAQALTKTGGTHPDVYGGYAAFLQNVVMPNAAFFSYLVTFGELAVALGLILGLFTGIAAFFGSFMNMNYLFAGTISTNPLLFILELFLILAWRVAGLIGLDRFALPLLGTPLHPGKLFTSKKK